MNHTVLCDVCLIGSGCIFEYETQHLCKGCYIFCKCYGSASLLASNYKPVSQNIKIDDITKDIDCNVVTSDEHTIKNTIAMINSYAVKTGNTVKMYENPKNNNGCEDLLSDVSFPRCFFCRNKQGPYIFEIRNTNVCSECVKRHCMSGDYAFVTRMEVEEFKQQLLLVKGVFADIHEAVTPEIQQLLNYEKSKGSIKYPNEHLKKTSDFPMPNEIIVVPKRNQISNKKKYIYISILATTAALSISIITICILF